MQPTVFLSECLLTAIEALENGFSIFPNPALNIVLR